MMCTPKNTASSTHKNLKDNLYTVYDRKKFLNVTPKYNDTIRPVLYNGLFCNQDYKTLTDHHRAAKTLFTDPIFKPNEIILQSGDKKKHNILWKRPKDIVKDPKFINSADQFHVTQTWNERWFLSVLSSFIDTKHLLRHVMHVDQTVDPTDCNYIGLFHFKFWQCGMWVDIVIDDYLPTLNGQLIYAQVTHKHEFWIALLEKAYAKLHGTYESVVSGDINEIIEDMTGGCGIKLISDTLEKDDVLHIIKNASFVCATSKHTTPHFSGHTYLIKDVYELENKTTLIRLQNSPDDYKWTGNWSITSKLWETLSKDDHVTHEDGFFFMSLEDFMYWMTIWCNVTHGVKKWNEQSMDGTWINHKNAMGQFCNTSFHMNPQYLLDLPRDNTIVVSLLQKWTRSSKYYHKKNTHFIGYKIYKLKRCAKKIRLGKEITGFNPIYMTRLFVNNRSTNHLLNLAKGCYIIVPSTFYPNKEGDYSLRVFSKSAITLREC
jgi:hypothetical protein